MIIGIFHAVTVALDILMRFGKKKGFIRTLVKFLTVRMRLKNDLGGEFQGMRGIHGPRIHPAVLLDDKVQGVGRVPRSLPAQLERVHQGQ
jgi:hypothetical protein